MMNHVFFCFVFAEGGKNLNVWLNLAISDGLFLTSIKLNPGRRIKMDGPSYEPLKKNGAYLCIDSPINDKHFINKRPEGIY